MKASDELRPLKIFYCNNAVKNITTVKIQDQNQKKVGDPQDYQDLASNSSFHISKIFTKETDGEFESHTNPFSDPPEISGVKN